MLMKKKIILIATLWLIGWSINAWSFTCKTSSGTEIKRYGGSADVYIPLAPKVEVGQNLVVDLSKNIECHNEVPGSYIDIVSLEAGSAYGGLLSNFSGTVRYNGASYPFPTTGETSPIRYESFAYQKWPVVLYLTPVSSAEGVAIASKTLIATLILRQKNNHGESHAYKWFIYSSNDVVVPTGGCDVSARDVIVSLPDYPGTTNIPVTVHCAKSQRLAYYLSGTTADAANTVFTNSASVSAAQGVGVQVSHNGSVLAANNTVSLGFVDTLPVNLGLTASYVRTSGQVTAGKVQSIIGVTFLYE